MPYIYIVSALPPDYLQVSDYAQFSSEYKFLDYVSGHFCCRRRQQHYTNIIHIWDSGGEVVGGGGKQGGFGVEQRHLMSEWQVIKISLSRYWRLPHRTGEHTSLLADRYTMEQCKKEKKIVIFTFFSSPLPSLHHHHPTPHSFCSSLAISRWVHSLVLSNFWGKK